MTVRPQPGRRAPGTRRLSALLLGPAVLLLCLFLPTQPASAHPLDVYLQASYLTITPSAISVEIDLSPGVLVAPRVLGQLDRDGDREISGTEARSYLLQVVDDARIEVDGQARALTLTGVDVPPYLTVQAGYGTLKVFASTTTSRAPATQGEHQALFRNGFADDRASYQINAFVGKGAPVVLGTQQRDPTQQQATVTYRVDDVAAAAVPAAGQEQAQPPGGTARLAGYLEDPSLSAWAVLFALGSAALLGALHALTPGHAKTLMAAYLVGSGGTVRDAAKLGAVVTVTHTASVIIIGLVALLASQFLVPGVLVPVLEAGSGLLVLALGVRLLRLRWPRRSHPIAVAPLELAPAGTSGKHSRSPHHMHEHAVGDGHGAITQVDRRHQHGGTEHTHALPPGGVTVRGLVAMGVSGGLVPCPEALGVMVLAVGVNRTGLGLGLIVSFSLGLAAVLIGLGVLLVRSRTLLNRLEVLPATWTSALPVLSAAVVTMLGAALVLRAIGPLGVAVL